MGLPRRTLETLISSDGGPVRYRLNALSVVCRIEKTQPPELGRSLQIVQQRGKDIISEILVSVDRESTSQRYANPKHLMVSPFNL